VCKVLISVLCTWCRWPEY